ncbi:MAG: metallophosphatase family protein [Verrucomicrobiota bacterium]|nr:metallophosphatase family protein [Verrucomicrobiota bacterium]
MTERIAVFGGVYSNHLALRALLQDAPRRGADRIFCLGDLGAFGPHPNKVFPLLRDAGVPVVQGNYDNSVGNNLADCQCGYTDAQDNYFARLSYDYTFRNTSEENKRWMRSLPPELRLELNGVRILLCHGSPRKTNEFLWETTTSIAFLERLCEAHGADVIVGTHTGLHWHRVLPSGRHFVNCGAIGRPANDGRTNVWYALISVDETKRVTVDFKPLQYDHAQLASEMRAEDLPEEFIQTIETGWWTTCLEVLPMKERARGIH